MTEENDVCGFTEPAEIEDDLARSAWHDKAFAVWFGPFAKKTVLFNGARGEAFFTECAEFAKAHKAAPGDSGDAPAKIIRSPSALEWFSSIEMPKLPGGKSHKPTSWQTEKARRYLSSRHNSLLAEQLADAERVRADGEAGRADRLAREARKLYGEFSDSASPCRRAMDDVDGLVGLAESNPPLFLLPGEFGRLLNHRMKPDNLGVFVADQKVGKTTDLVTIAVASARCVPTLFISTGDETQLKIDARITTHLSCMATQQEYAGVFALPVPDCAHNAAGTCPIGQSGKPRQVKDWKCLISDGAIPAEIADGSADGSRAVDGTLYLPCCRCYPKNDGTQEDTERRKRWRSAVWWRTQAVDLIGRQGIIDTRTRFEVSGGMLRTAAYSAGELSVEGLYALLDTLDRAENFVPETIVIDYADLMRQEEGRATDKDHDGMRRIWEGLRGITTKLKKLIVTASMTNGQSDGMETITRRMLGRSKKVADNCTWLATLNQTVQEKRAKVKRVSMLFAREGAFDPEHQALCCQWQEVQDGFVFSTPIFCKIKNEMKERE